MVLSGMVAGDPGHGGAAWAVLQYAVGLERLGHDVHLVEPVAPERFGARGAGVMRRAVAEVGFGGTATILDEAGDRTTGLSAGQLAELGQRADVLLNISGMLRLPELVEPIPVRAYLDLDPGFNQLWHAVCGIDMGMAEHTHHITVGLGLPGGSVVPTLGLDWIPTLPPVVLDRWPAVAPNPTGDVTTVANWRSYGSLHHEGRHFGQKAHSLRSMMDLPTRTRQRFTLALGIDPAEESDLAALRSGGWSLVDPRAVASSPSAYRSFLQWSKAELGVAKLGYVAGQTGWFSDRSACYLASGRPVVAQDTGFGDHLPTGEGLFAVDGVDDVLAALEDVDRRPALHHAAARRMAEEHLCSDKVLGRLMEHLGW